MDTLPRFPWSPALRNKAVADDGREFHNLITDALPWLETMPKCFKSGQLNKFECRQLWQWLGRTDRPPKRLRFFVYREDVETLFPPRQ